MRLGISMNPAHSSPVEWAEKLTAIGVNSVILPCSGETPDKVLDQYVQVCKDYDLQIAEVGAWRNVLAADPTQRRENLDYCKRQLTMADYVGARCCVNISGTSGERWDGPYKSNYGADAMARVVEFLQAEFDPEWAYNLDGGPSSALMYRDGNGKMHTVWKNGQKNVDIMTFAELPEE